MKNRRNKQTMNIKKKFIPESIKKKKVKKTEEQIEIDEANQTIADLFPLESEHINKDTLKKLKLLKIPINKEDNDKEDVDIEYINFKISERYMMYHMSPFISILEKICLLEEARAQLNSKNDINSFLHELLKDKPADQVFSIDFYNRLRNIIKPTFHVISEEDKQYSK